MAELFAGGFLGLLFLALLFPLLMIGTVLVVEYEWDRLFDGVPWPWLFLLVPLWIVIKIWQGLTHAN